MHLLCVLKQAYDLMTEKSLFDSRQMPGNFFFARALWNSNNLPFVGHECLSDVKLAGREVKHLYSSGSQNAWIYVPLPIRRYGVILNEAKI
jgi:hypothetical protein